MGKGSGVQTLEKAENALKAEPQDVRKKGDAALPIKRA
jgi:hypothetical protein